MLLCFAFGVGDDSLRVSSVVGNDGTEWLPLPTAWLIGEMTVDQVLILPEYRHKALPDLHCTTSLMIGMLCGLSCRYGRTLLHPCEHKC